MATAESVPGWPGIARLVLCVVGIWRLIFSAQSHGVVDVPPPPEGLGYLPREHEIVSINPPPLLWVPVRRACRYDVEIVSAEDQKKLQLDPVVQSEQRKLQVSSDDSTRVLIRNTPYSLYTHTEPLVPGRYAWRYRARWSTDDPSVSEWSRLRHFTVSHSASPLPRPTKDASRAAITANHPRMYIRPEDVSQMRAERSRFSQAWARLLSQADELLTAPLMKEPRPWTGG